MPTGSPGIPRGPYSPERKQAIRDGMRRRKEATDAHLQDMAFKIRVTEESARRNVASLVRELAQRDRRIAELEVEVERLRAGQAVPDRSTP